MLAVYLSNRFLRVVEGEYSNNKLHISKMHSELDMKGCLLNGTMMNSDGLLEMIKHVWETHHLSKEQVYLVIDGNQISNKVAEIPSGKTNAMMEYVTREFSDVERIEDPVYGFISLRNKGNKKSNLNRALVMMAARSYLQSFVDIFSQAGITICGIEDIRSSVLKLAGQIEVLKQETCIVQFADDDTLYNVLVQDGRHLYSSRSRLFSDFGTPEFAVEIARNVSNILQFSQTQNLDKPITKVYVVGLDEAGLDIYRDGIMNINENLEAESLTMDSMSMLDKEGRCYAFAIGGLIVQDEKTSLLAQMHRDPVKEKKKEQMKKVLLPITALAVVMLVFTGVLAFRHFSLKNQLNEVLAYNQSQTVLESCQKYDEVSKELQKKNVLINSMQELGKRVLTYPLVNSDTETVVERCADGLVFVEISRYNATSGVLSFNTSASNIDNINEFVKLLRQESIFRSVDYTGYSQDSSGTWKVKVNCIMESRQGEGQ